MTLPIPAAFRRLLLFALAWWTLVEALAGGAAAARAEQMVNRGRFDLFVAFGAYRDGSIAGLGDNGYVDPNAGRYSTFWTKLPAGGSIEIPRNYAGYVRVVANIGGRQYVVNPERPMAMWYFPLLADETKGGSAYVKMYGNPNNADALIRAKGFNPKYFFPVNAYRTANNAPVVVLRSEAIRNDLEKEFGYRRLAVVGFTNESNLRVTFNFRWTSQDSWTSKTLEANQSWMWWTSATPVQPQISFDEGIDIPGSQTRNVNVRPFDVTIQGAGNNPTFDHASRYKFVANGNRLQVFER